MPENNVIQYEIKNHIGYITINRPEVLNCFDFHTLVSLETILDEIALDTNIRVIIITGSGHKAFSAGADLKERKSLSESQVRRNVNKIRDVFNKVANLPQPTIAAVNGYALGGGFELMLACDLRVAASNVKMGVTELSWAIIPGAGGTQRLPRLIGETRAKELIFTARKIDSEEAYQLGLLNRVVNQSELLSACEQLAENMLLTGPVALKQAKYSINYGLNTDLTTGLGIEAKAYELTIPTEDRLEALQAFSEKRRPHFLGK